jgi:hypothetical protein
LLVWHLQDGFVQLATANLQQLCKETIYDVTQVMKMGATDKPLSFDNFVDLMLAVEVPALILLLLKTPIPASDG